jgi:hypothetical protein
LSLSDKRGEARRGSTRRKHHLVYCCVIAGTYFEVAVLAWSKYATISKMDFKENVRRIQVNWLVIGFNWGLFCTRL